MPTKSSIASAWGSACRRTSDSQVDTSDRCVRRPDGHMELDCRVDDPPARLTVASARRVWLYLRLRLHPLLSVLATSGFDSESASSSVRENPRERWPASTPQLSVDRPLCLIRSGRSRPRPSAAG